MIIAIDGPAASGKSTVSKAVAARLGFGYLDTGAMYRAIALATVEEGISLHDETAIAAIAERVRIGFEREDGSLPTKVLLDGKDVTAAIRTPQINHAVSPVAAVPGVRVALVAAQREIARGDDYVVEGRDIGTVVFPDAEVKIFLTASNEERARRRTVDLADAGHATGKEAVAQTLERRDKIDSTREASPLVPAEDAVLLDTTELNIEEVVEAVADLAGESSCSSG